MTVKAIILLLITKADVGGAQIHVLELLSRLKDRYHFILAAGEDDYLTIQARQQGFEVRVLQYLKRPINLKLDWMAYRECVKLINEIKPDLLHTHSSKAGVVGRLAALRTGVPSLFTAHGWAFTEGAPGVQRLYGLLIESFLCRLPGSVVTISDYDFTLAARYHVGWSKRRHLVRNGVSEPSIELKSMDDAHRQSDNSTVQILTVGRLSAVKNHRMLLEALSLLKCPFEAQIVGEGECHAQLSQQLEALNLSGKVRLMGEVTELSGHFERADLFVLSSNYEGLPLSVLEAMSYGLAVVATNVGGVKEAVLDHKTGLLSGRSDAAALAANIEKLVADSQLRTRYGEQGILHYKACFTALRMVSELESLYRDLLAKR